MIEAGMILDFVFCSFVVPWGISRRGHCFSVGCCSRTLCGRGRARASSSGRSSAISGGFIQSCPHAARNMIISQFITFAPGS